MSMLEKDRFRYTNYEPANTEDPVTQENDESPPAYDSLFGRIIQFSEEVSGPKEYTVKVGSLVCKSGK